MEWTSLMGIRLQQQLTALQTVAILRWLPPGKAIPFTHTRWTLDQDKIVVAG